jgi:endonuclease/exonuclease/phosphatase family metal-dependent hydrolase
VRVRVLTWNLKHGRSVPGSGRDLFDEFARALAGWDWDVALLQEVPPWWPVDLAAVTGSSQRHVLTSRNALLPVRQAIGTRWPDAIRSNAGGANAILVRGMSITRHRAQLVSRIPERRRVHAVRLASLWVANVHSGASLAQARLAAETSAAWAGADPVVLGGDFNLRLFQLDGFRWAGGYGVDHVFARGLAPAPSPARVLDSGPLSDHPPVVVTLTLPGPSAARSP